MEEEEGGRGGEAGIRTEEDATGRGTVGRQRAEGSIESDGCPPPPLCPRVHIVVATIAHSYDRCIRICFARSLARSLAHS